MSCNCATSEQLKELHARFGVKRKIPRGATLKYKVGFYLTNFFSAIILITTMPLMLHLACNELYEGNHNISLTKFLNLKHELV